jgi:hypothetical protein
VSEPNDDNGALRESALDRIDEVCDGFEQAWQQALAGGPRPVLDHFLRPASGRECSALLLELVALDIDYRVRQGEVAQAAEYGERFPDVDTAWLEQQLTAAAARAGALPLGPTDTKDSYATLPPGVRPSSPTAWPVIPGYEIQAELGRGGMGVVYEARQVRANRTVALKMVLAGSHASPEELSRFRIEAEAIARLQHPNIVQIHEVAEHDCRPFFSLEFCPGGSLDKKLNGKPLPSVEAAKLLEALARAVQAAHEGHIIHRNLKPANVLLGADGAPKITDFGLAKMLDAVGHTGSGAIMGTPPYMAPEQAAGKRKEVGPAVDTYALGAILYELLTGQPPFKGATAAETLMQVMTEEPVPVRRLQRKVPRDLETICHKCLQKEPARRFATASELADDLRRFLDGESIRARRVGRVERVTKWVRHRPGLAVAWGLLLVGLAV